MFYQCASIYSRPWRSGLRLVLNVESASEMQSRDAEKGTGWGTRSPTPFAGQRRPTPALPVDAVSIATGGGRAGPESGSRGAASPAPAPAPNPRPGSPACGAGLAPVGVTASFSPSPRSPNHWDPEPASGSSSSWGSGGVAMAGGPARRSEGCLRGRGAVPGRPGSPCCCPRLDSGLGEAAVSAPPPLLQLRPSCWLPLSPLQLLLLPLLFLPAPPRPAACAPPPPTPAAAAASLLPSLLLRRWKWPASS